MRWVRIRRGWAWARARFRALRPPEPVAAQQARLADMGALPLDGFAQSEWRVVLQAGLLHWPRPLALRRLAQSPEVAPQFLCHPDGFVREAALAALRAPLRQAWQVIALAWRLNDWVREVRAAAQAAAARVLPQTAPGVIATAMLVLAPRLMNWRRWQDGGAALDAAVARPEVAAALAQAIASAPTGPMTRVLAALLRHGAMDRHLPVLAARALQPGVRALAARTLIAGEARWPMGQDRRWIDKSLGVSRMVPIQGSRPVARPGSLEALIQAAARDRSALVRRVAAAAIEAHGPGLGDLDGLIALLANDRSPAVRSRIAWVQRHRAGWTGPGPAA